MATPKPYLSILSLDGGGIRGVIPAVVMQEIEKQTGYKICELFDLIAGTSTGGILAVGCTVPDEEGKPKFSAEKLLGLYQKEGGRIFKKPGGLFGGIRMAFNAKFKPDGIESVLSEYFGDKKLSDCLSDVLVTSYDSEMKKPFYFYSRYAREQGGSEDFEVRQVARSTSAAPTYFPPNLLPYSSPSGKGPDRLSLLDGGVFANNPSLLAYIEARELWKKASESDAMSSLAGSGARPFDPEVEATDEDLPFLLVSIGTGQTMRPYKYEQAKKWGLLKWVQPIIDILMQGVSESVHYQMQHLLPKYGNQKRRYYRLNIRIASEHSEMDDASPESINRLIQYGQELVEKEKDNIAALSRQLVEMMEARKRVEKAAGES